MAGFNFELHNEDRFKEIEKAYDEIGISIYDDDGTLKSQMDLLSELSELYYQKIEEDGGKFVEIYDMEELEP